MQTITRQAVNIRPVFAHLFKVGFKMHPHIARSRWRFADEFVQHILPHFKCRCPNRRTQPCLNVARALCLHGLNGFFQHAINQTTPTRMRCADHLTIATTKKYGQAIRRHHHAHLPMLSEHHGIGLRWWRAVIVFIACLQVNDGAVGLIEPQRFTGQKCRCF